MINYLSHSPFRWREIFFYPSFPAGLLTNCFTFRIFLSTDGNVVGCGYHFGSADNDNPLAFLSSQKCGALRGCKTSLVDICYAPTEAERRLAKDLSKWTFVIFLTCSPMMQADTGTHRGA